HSLVPLLVTLFIVSQVFRGTGSGPSFFIVAVFLLLGIARIGDLVRPRQLVLDDSGVTFHPSFKAAHPKIPWSAVRDFAIEGSKNKLLVLHYVDGGKIRRLALGTDWCLDDKSLWGVTLVGALLHVSDYHQRAVAYAGGRHAPPSSVVAPLRTSPPKVAQPLQPATTRSGVVYAEKAAPQTRPVSPSLNGETKSLKGLGVALMVVGGGVSVLSVIPFVKACNQGLCGQGLWDMGDYRIWLFATLWTVCLLAVVAGGMIMAGAREDGR
ncbi:hypothetical protein, partial [Brevundimonas sp.]